MKIQSLGVFCELDSVSADGRSSGFSVVEFVVFADGRKVILHDDRGWSGRVSWYGELGTAPTEHPTLNYSTYMTIDTMVDAALLVLIPDDIDPPDDHDWARLVRLFAELGVSTNRAELRALPFVIEFGDRVLDTLGINRDEHRPAVIDWDER